jgi:hypothetical protein
MNILEFNPDKNKDIAFCFVDNTRYYQNSIREFMKNQADGTLTNVYNKGYTVFQWTDEDALIVHACNKGYKWAVVFSTGTEFINGDNFFNAIQSLITEDFFIAGHILDRGDAFYELHHQCYVINLEKFKNLKYPIVGQQQLCNKHIQVIPKRSSNNIHDDYTPIWITPGEHISEEYQHKCHGWNVLSTALTNNEKLIVFEKSIRDNKIHFYPESPVDFYKQLSWAYFRLNFCQSEFIHTSNTEEIHLPIKQYDQIVTPASGIWFEEYVSQGATVIMYDYNSASLDYWKQHVPSIKNIKYKFVKCDLLGNDNLVDYIEPIDNTLVHLSNIFNYEATNFFYSLDYRMYKENKLLSALPKTAKVYFNLRANIFDTTPTWHINS